MASESLPAKSSKSKLARMSEQERLRHLEKRQAEEQALRRNKQSLTQTFITAKLNKEHRMQLVNGPNLIEKWRAILRESKSNELNKGISILSQAFQRGVHQKSVYLDVLVQELSECQQEQELVFSTHQNFLCNMGQIQERRLNHLMTLHRNNVRALIDKTADNVELDRRNAGEFGDKIDLIALAGNISHDEKLERAQSHHAFVSEQLHSKAMEELERYRLSSETTCESLNSLLQSHFSSHKARTGDLIESYKLLKKRDEMNTAEMESNTALIDNLTEELNNLKVLLASKEENSELNKLRIDLELARKRLREAQRLSRNQMNNQHLRQLANTVHELEQTISEGQRNQRRLLQLVDLVQLEPARVELELDPVTVAETRLKLLIRDRRRQLQVEENQFEALKRRIGDKLVQ